ncbi:BTAD domain-containing putative transcriptional regulator [Streptomyces sp. NPDC002130]|uniref:AfsR/SARP family transcriptional regulator n=1 Tax=Streptomyces sp. NPDC002130 TaxID=3155568 RepID=UPI003316B0B1
MSTRYEFRVLGPLEVLRDGRPVRIDAAKVRLLLAALLTEVNHVVTVDTLVHRLWGDGPPGRARNTLQNYVLRLRRALGCPAGGAPVLTRPHGYVIETAPDALGLHRFTALVRQGRTALEEGAAALDEQRLDAMELRIDADLTLGRAADVLPELRGLSEEYPLRENFWAQRMLALFHCGRQGEALESYREITALLADELGVAPGAGLRQVHRRLLTATPDLIEARAVRTASPPRDVDLPVEMTTFVGRETEMAEARHLPGTARLVTLTGVGRVGKTRLALRVAAEVAPSFADGVRLADLAPLSDADLLDRTVSEALGHGEAERALAPLQEALARQQAIGDSWGPVWGLETLAWAVAATGDCTRAAWLLGAAHRMRRDTGVALIGLRPFHEAHRTAERRVRASLDTEEYTAAWSRGASAEDALRQAREKGTSPAGPARTRTGGSRTPTA